MGAIIGGLLLCFVIVTFGALCEKSKICQKALVWVSKNIMGVTPAGFPEE